MNKNNSFINYDDSKASANVKGLRKLFESNFKLSDITKPFKSKNDRSSSKNVEPKNFAFDVDGNHQFPKFTGNKENRQESGLKKATSPAGCYVNCKIENCCCKTFFRQYDETPTLRYRPLPRVPLQECNYNSRFDRHHPERWSATSCSSYTLSKQQKKLCDHHLQQHSFNYLPPKLDLSQNKFYNINYKFYKSKSQEMFDETPVSAVLTNPLEQIGRNPNILEEMKNNENVESGNVGSDHHNENGGSTLLFQKTETSQFDNFDATASKNIQPAKIRGENHLKREKVKNAGLSEQENEVEEASGKQTCQFERIDLEEPNINDHVSSFGFKYRPLKLKNAGLRENSHPYSLKKPRLTVKGVKNRNMRSVKRRQKSPEGSTLGRCQTFSGYDNFAFRSSIINQQSLEQLEETVIPLNDSIKTTVDVGKPSAVENTIRSKRPASMSVIGVDDSTQFHLDSRMISYDWPVTSFHTKHYEMPLSRTLKSSSNTFHNDAKPSSLEKNPNFMAKKTNLKRYRSLGYLEEELSEYNPVKHYRSLENMNKASEKCEIQNVPKINEVASTKKLQNAYARGPGWQDVTKKDLRFTASLSDTLDEILTSLMVDHPYLKNNAEMFRYGADLFVNQHRKKTSIKQLFTVSSKFQKHLKRGVYLAFLLYHDDKVLVTYDDFLPVIEVDENYPRKIQNDFHWFFKVACNWNDLKWVKDDLEKSANDSLVFRIKLLRAAAHMQNILGLQELGRLYYKVLRDVEGTIVLSVINHVHFPKSVSVFNLRWMPVTKLDKKANLANSFRPNLSDVLIASVLDQITYHQASKRKLPRGLYLSYLKMNSSVDSLEVLVPFRTPNILPHCKIRDNPHVTAEEWKMIAETKNFRESLAAATHQQNLFIEQIVLAAIKLFSHMNVPDEEAFNHRLYDEEVIEVNDDVSLIMIVPSAEISCSVSNQREVILRRPYLFPLPVQVFEMIHFEAYQPELITLYSKLSCIIETDIDLAQYNLRQAFNDFEVNSAKYQLHRLETLQTQLNTAWKSSKWLLDVICFARDRFSVPRIRMQELLSVHPKCALSSIESNYYLLSSDMKTAKSRGIWPESGAGCRSSRMKSRINRCKRHSKPNAMEASITDVESVFDKSSSSSINSFPSDELSAPSKVILPQDSYIENVVHIPPSKSGVMEVYADYDTGLDSQIHFQFLASPTTTARDIVSTFVKQTKIIRTCQERPILSDEDLSKFCLVAADETREFSLHDNFLLSRFEWLWEGARLYVRRRSSLLKTIDDDLQSSYV